MSPYACLNLPVLFRKFRVWRIAKRLHSGVILSKRCVGVRARLEAWEVSDSITGGRAV